MSKDIARPEKANVSKNAVLLISTIASFITPFTASSVNIALPSIGREFAMNAILLSWVATAYLLASAAFLIPMGRIGDIHGRKRIFIYGILIYTVSSLLLSCSTSCTLLISSRIFQGIGTAMMVGTGTAILTSVFSAEERGKALGINVAAVYLGHSLGPFLGGFLTQYLGWRSIFLVNVPAGLVIIYFILWKLTGEWADEKGAKFDLTGSIIYSLTLVAIMYGFSLLPAMSGGWLIIGSVLGGLTFVRWEMKVKSPVLNLNLFRNNAVFVFSNLATLINYIAIIAVSFLLSLYLQYIKGLSPQIAGLVLISQPVVQAIFSPLAGRLSDRIEPRIVASIGMVLTFISLSLLTSLNGKTTLGFIVTSLILLGFGIALFSSPNTNAVMSSVDKRFFGVASAMLGTMRLIGGILSMGIAMLVFSVYIGRTQITQECYPLLLTSMKIAFAIFAALCFGGIFASLARGKIR